jgi:hypothetical protein
MPDAHEARAVSIAPAGGWRAAFVAYDGWGSARTFAVPLALWALDAAGEVRGLVVGADGRLASAESDDFLGYCEPEAMIPQRYTGEARRRAEARDERERMVSQGWRHRD